MLRPFNTKAIDEMIAEKEAEAESIFALAEQEDRDLTADEQKAFNAIVGSGKEGEQGFVAGEIAALRDRRAQAKKREELQANILESRAASGQIQLGTGDEEPAEKRITVPATAKARRSLKAFSGEQAEEEAFMTGHWLAANFGQSKRSAQWLSDHGVSNAMTEGDSSKGGLFVPAETETAIIRQVENFGVIRRTAQISSMGSDRKVHPVRVSGVTAYPVGETEAGTITEPQWRSVELIARKWKVITKMSEDLNEDSLISLADQFVLESGLAFANAEDTAGFNGDGTSTYHGIVGLANALAAGSIATAATGNTAFSTLDAADFLAAVGKVPDYPGIMPAWFISKPGYFASMGRLKEAAGGNTVAEMTGGVSQLTYLGYPVIWSHVLNKTLTAQTDTVLAYFGDMRMTALFGDRRGITMSMTDDRYWDTDEIGLKGTERFDFNVYSTGDATNAGAMVAIKTPGS